jgi:hypothetical protein
MKNIAAVCLTLFLIGAVMPAFAQDRPPNPGAEEHWQQFLSRHPGLAEHPQWLRNPQYMREHPNIATWLREHPRVLEDSREQGMWDNDGGWHDANWWRANHPDYVDRYHPEWAENHPDWRGPGDGDWDEHHQQWHARQWWVAHNRAWVVQHHANWLAHHDDEGPDHHD